MTDSIAIQCTLTQEEQRVRRSKVRATIVPHLVDLISVDDGLRLNFGECERLRDIVEEFIMLEQSCCGFLAFTLSPPGEELALLTEDQ
jgi:hypothetical protein